MSNEHEFLDIPCDEHIVPFPNTAAVIMQHAREFPERTAFQFPDSSYTYSELLGICRNISLPENTGIVLSFKDIQNSLILMLALLYRGIPFHLDLGKNTNYRFPGISSHDSADAEIPFVKLDDRAFTLNRQYCFSQYNILAAAQAAGIAFKLFRPGYAVCALPVETMSDLCFGILAPLYFAKTLRFDIDDPADAVISGAAQYAYAGLTASSVPVDTAKLLRDAAILFKARKDVFSSPVSFYIEEAIPYAAGLSPVTDNSGRLLSFLGAEMQERDGRWIIRGHCLGEKTGG